MRVPHSCLVWFILSFFVFPAVLFGQDPGSRDRDGEERGKREYSREQIEGYLKRLDRNESQVLELDEMSDRTKRWLGGLGLDTSRPIKLSTAMRSVDSDKAAKAKAERRKQLEANRLVPGFGVEDGGDSEFSPVPDFSGSAPITPGSLEEKYGKGVMQQVDSTLERYDTNKSGTLNSQEIAAARWGRPTPQESDTNKDGRLSRSELAERYAARSAGSRSSSSRDDDSNDRGSSSSERSSSRDSQSRSSSSRSSSSRSSSSRSSGGSDLKSRMERYESDVKNRYDKEKSSPEKPSQRNSSAYNSGSDRYKRYADALLKQYDKDKDNKLSKTEVKSMRRPPNQADSNGDGMITRDELIESISNPKSSSSSSSSSEERTSRSSSRSRFSDRSRSSSDSRESSSSSRSSSSSSKSVSFSGNDTNKDGQLQMHEFARDWDAETLEEFKKKDKNNDGIITRSEWTGR